VHCLPAVQCSAIKWTWWSAPPLTECCGKACASGLLYDDSSGNTALRSSPGGSPACRAVQGWGAEQDHQWRKQASLKFS
jgi:hypothetical protein